MVPLTLFVLIPQVVGVGKTAKVALQQLLAQVQDKVVQVAAQAQVQAQAQAVQVAVHAQVHFHAQVAYHADAIPLVALALTNQLWQLKKYTGWLLV
jgi:hypothetical protein